MDIRECRQFLVFLRGIQITQVKLTKISEIGTQLDVLFRQFFYLFKVLFKQLSVFFMAQFRQVFVFFMVQFRQVSILFMVQFRQVSAIFKVWLRQVSSLFKVQFKTGFWCRPVFVLFKDRL
jgi:hypothetical protein